MDKLLVHAEESEEGKRRESESLARTGRAIRCLNPDQVRFFEKANIFSPRTTMWGEPFRVFFVRAFPASHPDKYLSVRHWSPEGDDNERGIIRDLQDWSPETCGECGKLMTDTNGNRFLVEDAEKLPCEDKEHFLQ